MDRKPLFVCMSTYIPSTIEDIATRANPRRIGTDYIDKKTHEIKQDEDKVVYKSLDEIADDLPDNTPRYILLSYPLTLV